MLTEAQVQKSFIALVHKSDKSGEVLEKAEALLEHLRPESPLRHRLQAELDEIRHLATAK